MHNIDTYIISGRVNTAGSEQNFHANDARTVILPAKGKINEDGCTEKADETIVKIIGKTKKNPKMILADPNDIHSIDALPTISQNGDMVGISQNQRTIRINSQQTFINAVFQSTLLLFNSVLITFTLIRR
jgi:hypothetical protein